MKDQSQEAGDHSNQYQAARDMEVHHHGLTIEQMDELKKHVNSQVASDVAVFVNSQMEVFKNDFLTLQGQAFDQALRIAQHLLSMFVEQLAAKAPENLQSIQTVSMQHAIFNAQTSAAVADDDELTATLVDILVDKSGTEPRSFKGVVLTEALEVAGKLTADQVNLLTALVMLTQTTSHGWRTEQVVLEQLDAQCRPLYGKIPTNRSAVQYMSYTGVGDINRLSAMIVGGSIATKIIDTYDAVFTSGFPCVIAPDELKQYTDFLIPLSDRDEDAGRCRFKLASSQTLETVEEGPLLPHKEQIQQLIVQNHLPVEKFTEAVESAWPDLAKFIRDLDEIFADSFVLSTVGIAVGQANWRRLQPESAPAFDVYLS